MNLIPRSLQRVRRRPPSSVQQTAAARTTNRQQNKITRSMLVVVGLSLVARMLFKNDQGASSRNYPDLLVATPSTEVVTNLTKKYTISATVERPQKPWVAMLNKSVDTASRQVHVIPNIPSVNRIKPETPQEQRQHPPQETVFFDGNMYRTNTSIANNNHQIQRTTANELQQNRTSNPLTQIQCAKHAGYIVANMNGRLANNLFQIAMANHLAEQLCWTTIFKENWQGVFPNDARANECFPQAMKPYQKAPLLLSSTPTSQPYTATDVKLFKELNIKTTTNRQWDSPAKFLSEIHDGRKHKKIYEMWWGASIKEGTSRTIGSRWEHDYHKHWVEDLVTSLRSPPNATIDRLRAIHLNAYFIQYDWMKNAMPQIRQWLRIDEGLCCHYVPSPNTVVIHVRNFENWEQLNPKYEDSVYTELLDTLYFANDNKNANKQPYDLAIVCQPKDVKIALIQNLKERYNATVVVGEDPYDAFCALSRAHHLVMATHSTFSQMAALVSPHNTYFDNPHDQTQAERRQQVHYLLPYRLGPEVTLVIPQWDYHLVKHNKKGIDQYHVPTSQITSVMS